MTCPHCATDAREYRGMCTGCVIRRLARLSPFGLNNVLTGIGNERPHEAQAYRAKAEQERLRLKQAGTL